MTYPIDQTLDQCLALRPRWRPGVRDVAGHPYVYDADLLLSYEAREMVRAAPDDLSDLTRAELDTLATKAMRRWFDTSGRDAVAGTLHERVWNEIEARKRIPVLKPITVAVRRLDPAIWGRV